MTGPDISNPAIPDLMSRFSGEGSGVAFVGALLRTAVTFLLIVGSLYFFFQILLGGIAWIGAGSDKAQLEEARNKLYNAGIGLLILFSAWAVVGLVEAVFGINILILTIPTLAS